MCWNKDQEEKQYRSYITDVLQLMGENIASLVHGSYVTDKWRDLVNCKPQDDRTADEIVIDIMTRGGLSFKGGETNELV